MTDDTLFEGVTAIPTAAEEILYQAVKYMRETRPCDRENNPLWYEFATKYLRSAGYDV